MGYSIGVTSAVFLVAAVLICCAHAQERNYTVARGSTLVPTDAGGLLQFFEEPGKERLFDLNVIRASGFPQQIKIVPSNRANSYRLQAVLSSHWMEVDANLANTSRASTVLFQPTDEQGSGIVDYYVRSDMNPPELRLVTTQPVPRIVRFDLTQVRSGVGASNAFIYDSQRPALNPRPISGDLSNILGVFYDNDTQFEYIISGQIKVTRQKAGIPTDYFEPSETFTRLENSSARSYVYDDKKKVLYFAGVAGRVHRLILNDNQLNASIDTTFVFNTTNQSIAGLALDTVNDRLYVVTVGTVENPIRVLFINVSGPVNNLAFNYLTEVRADANDYGAVGCVLDPLGLLYITVEQSPPSIVQIDVANRNYENTLRLGPENGVQKSLVYHAPTRSIYGGSYDVSTRIALIRFVAAYACEENCYTKGVCLNRRCTCQSGVSPFGMAFTWEQPWCQSRPCDRRNGLVCGGPEFSLGCANGTCLCNTNYTGALCELRQCPRNCSGVGTCSGAAGGYTCQCPEGLAGDDCSLITALPCHRYFTCATCQQNPSCGWCDSAPVLNREGTNSSQCLPGNVEGPLFGDRGCRSWHYQECPSAAITAGSAVIAALVGILFLINGVSFIWEDSASERVSKRLQWYRFQRSSKAYAALFQLQYFAVVTIIAVSASTAFVSYTRVWLPIVGVHGFGITGPRNLVSSVLAPLGAPAAAPLGARRAILSMTQSLVYADFHDSELMRGVMATWAVLLLSLVVVYLIGFFICAIIRGSDRLMELLMRRPLYILLRSIEIGYFPMVVFGAAQLSLTTPQWNILGGFFYVLIGILYPVGMTVLVMVIDRKTLFKDSFSSAFYPFYGTVDHKKAWVAALPFLKKFIIGSAFGFGIFSLLGQLIVTLITCVVYIVAILFLAPYVDYLQQYVDIVTTAFTALSTLPLFGFVLGAALTPSGVLGITLVFIILNVLSVASCIGFYIYSWCQMKGIFSLSHCAKCLTCKDE